MKTTSVVESLSTIQPDVLFQRLPAYFKVTKDSTAFPVPKQLITNETETITTKQIPSINTEQTLNPDLIYRPFPRPLENFITKQSRK